MNEYLSPIPFKSEFKGGVFSMRYDGIRDRRYFYFEKEGETIATWCPCRYKSILHKPKFWEAFFGYKEREIIVRDLVAEQIDAQKVLLKLSRTLENL